MSELESECKRELENAERLAVELTTIGETHDTVARTMGAKVKELEKSVREHEVRKL